VLWIRDALGDGPEAPQLGARGIELRIGLPEGATRQVFRAGAEMDECDMHPLTDLLLGHGARLRVADDPPVRVVQDHPVRSRRLAVASDRDDQVQLYTARVLREG